MNIDDLSVNISQLSDATLLEDWQWLIGEGMRPVLITLAGDAFLQCGTDGSIHYLDTVEGACTQVAGQADEFKQLLQSPEFVMQHFSVNLVAPLIKSGQKPGDRLLYSFSKPPCLGGDYATDNLEPTDVSVHFSVSGQIWQQVKALPEGTSVDSVSIR